jgi:hypothetical protein
MLGCVRDRKAGPLGQNLNGTLALCKLLQQFEAMAVAQPFRNSGKLGE